MTEPPDLGLTLPMRGVVLVEASAGTGKTFALATLYSRAVIRERLAVDALLAVTFTEAATAELRARVRERLARALQLADGAEPDADEPADASTAALVAAALAAGEPAAALRARLRAAAEAMDLAPVYTIHQFCRRALADHALDAGHAPGDVELVTDERALREEVATALWRNVSAADADDARTLVQLWKSPAAFAAQLPDLWSVETLLPAPAAADAAALTAARAAVDAAGRALADACRDHGDAGCAAILAAIATGGMNATTHKAARVEKLWPALRAWAADGGAGAPADPGYAIFGTAKLAKAVTKAGAGKVVAPCDPFTDAVDAWFAADAELAVHEQARRIALVHRLRDDARARLAALKRQRRLRGFDDLIGDLDAALAGAHGDGLAARLRAQYRIAFVDEFQDTDPRQWAIFRRVFAPAPADDGVRALFLIGDPKQAIYRFRGGDVFTYLAAAGSADDGGLLLRNFRSRPRALVAVQALYAAAADGAFGPAEIVFAALGAGGRVDDDDLRIDGEPAPGLTLLTWDDADGTPSADAARARAATACAARIRALLAPGAATLRGRHGHRAIAPGDIAVLVATHREAQVVQRTLARAGVPSLAAGRDSLYASDEAGDLLALLEACLHLADDGRLRAALATPLLGLDAAAIAALDADGDAHRGWQDRALGWRQRWERHGPLALVGDLAAAAAPRLLTLADGERRLANWLQLGESLQAETAGHGPAATAAHLASRLAAAAAGGGDEDLLRLESDAARVRVLTLHRSKGLEFPLVFLPFLSHPAGARPSRGPALARFHADGERIGRLEDADGDAWKAAGDAEKAEAAGEQRRLVYVSLTRARLATFACFGPTTSAQTSAFATLLFAPREMPKPLAAAAIRARLEAIAASAPDAIVVADAATALPAGAPALPPPPPLPPARDPQRRLARDWGLHSFSALAREAGGGDTRRAGDETEPALAPGRFAGARFGNVLHDALEHVDFAAWRDWSAPTPPPGQAEALDAALRRGGYAGASELADGVALLATLVRDTLNAPLPEGVRLAALAPAQRQAELEFHFALAPAEVAALLAQLHAHGFVAARRGFGQRERLEGLLTGFIDLVYEHDDRVYLLDYKSNVLPGYAPAQLAEAIAHSEYDLQFLLYTLALHRWLAFRRPDYDYDRHFGGVRYLFCRGLGGAPGDGVYATRPPRALVEALDRLLRRAEAVAP